MLCGLATWRERTFEAADRSETIARPTGTAPTAATPQPRDLSLAGPAQAIPLPDLVRRLLLWRGRPWTFRDLQSAVAELLGVRDRPLLSLSGEGEGDGHGGEREGPDAQARFDPPETRAGAHRELEGRQFLTALWLEVRELPVGQRRALLLNLRDDQGRDRLALLTLTGLATREDLARLLDLPEKELATLWGDLPLDDRTIALRFELTPRQVINLRKSARARLARRLRSQHSPSWA
jgi:hypothetical protein